MKVQCYGCGEDCSHAYATHKGYPYHFGCLPLPKPRRFDGEGGGLDRTRHEANFVEEDPDEDTMFP